MFKRKNSKKKMMESSELGQRWSSQEQLEEQDGTSNVEEKTTSKENFQKMSSALQERFNTKDIIEEIFHSPSPVADMKSSPFLGEELVAEYLPLVFKILEWSMIFFLGHFGFSYAWILCLGLLYLAKKSSGVTTKHKTDLPAFCLGKNERDVLAERMEFLPSWVTFPDIERVEWINTIIKKVWPNIGNTAKQIAKKLVEPKIQEILNRLRLEDLSNFKLKDLMIGSIPARIGGIKVYDSNTGREEIVVDLEVIYGGDCRVKFTVQNMDCEINQVKFRGTVRLIVKPLLDEMPIVGGFELYFMQMPSLEYNLGGMANFAEIPGISSIIRSVIERIIRTRFVWPNRFSFYFPLESVISLNDQSFCMPSPQGVLTVIVIEGRDLMKKDKHLLGGKSDPYCTLSVGEQKISFVDRYIDSTVNPVWNYSADFAIEEASGMDLHLEVFDYDQGSDDDFLGRTTIPVTNFIESGGNERWITLDDAKHGDVKVRGYWRPTIPAGPSVSQGCGFIVSVFIDSCSEIHNGKSSAPYPKCEVKVASGEGFMALGRRESRKSQSSSSETNKCNMYTTIPRGPSHNPVFKEGHFFLSRQPPFDTIGIQVVDHRGGNILAQLGIKVSYIMSLPDKEFNKMEFKLENSISDNAKIVLSAKLFAY